MILQTKYNIVITCCQFLFPCDKKSFNLLIFYVKIIFNKFIKKEFLYEIRKNVITLHLFRGGLFISCTPETPKNEQLSYPQNLSEADKSKIKNLSYESYSEILESFKTLNSLEPVKNEYNNFLQNVINQLESNNFEVEELEFDNIEEMTNFLLEEKNLENTTNLAEYLDLQNNFESVKTEYENFYNGEYFLSYQDLQTKYYEANANITKNQYNELINFLKSVFEDIQEDFILNKQTNLIETTNIRFTEAQTENTSNTKQINDYKNSTEKSTYDAKKIDLETLKQLVVEAKKSADDFTLIYDTENPDEPEINPDDPEVNPDEPEINPDDPVELVSITVKTPPTKKYYFFNDDIRLDGLVLTEHYSDGTTNDFTLHSGYIIPDDILTKNKYTLGINTFSFKYRDYTISFEIEIHEDLNISRIVHVKKRPNKTHYFFGEKLDLSGMILTVSFYDSYEYMDLKWDDYDWYFTVKDEEGNILYHNETAFTEEGIKKIILDDYSSFTITVSDPNAPVDYTNLDMFVKIDGEWKMKDVPSDLTKYSEQTSVSYNIPAGQEVAIDIDILLPNKEKLEKANVPVSLNIPSDSTISFWSEGYPGMDFTQIKPIMDFLLGDKIDEYKNATDKTNLELPKMDLTVYNDMIGDGNLYGTGLDKVIEMYYNTNNKEKLNYENYTGGVFDAVDALQDGKMYDEENNFIDAYALDINAALLMGATRVKNVKVVGENKTGKSKYNNSFNNTRFETDLTGFVFNGVGSGIIDYAGSAPALTLDGGYGKTIIRKPSENMIVKGGHTVDLSNVENSSLLDNIAEFRGASEIYYKTQEDATRGYSSSSVDAIYIGDKLYSKDNTYTPVNATNQQWVDASNNDLWSKGEDGSYYPKDVHNEAEEWVFE